jgi:hypothetical protein
MLHNTILFVWLANVLKWHWLGNVSKWHVIQCDTQQDIICVVNLCGAVMGRCTGTRLIIIVRNRLAIVIFILWRRFGMGRWRWLGTSATSPILYSQSAPWSN